MNSALEEIVTLARRQVALEGLVEELEQSLSAMKEELRAVSQEDLPSAMREARLKTFTLDTGETISIKDDFAIQLANAKKEDAFRWLEKQGYGSLIKTEVRVSFGKGEMEKAQRLLAEMTKRKLSCGLSRDVHYQTLKAFINERTREAKPVPLDLFGAVAVNVAKISAPKN